MLVRYTGNEEMYNIEEVKSTIFKVVQFLPVERNGFTGKYTQTMAIAVPLYDGKWNVFKKDSYIGYKNVNPKKLHTFDIKDLDVVMDEEIPENIQRDMKLSFLLKE